MNKFVCVLIVGLLPQLALASNPCEKQAVEVARVAMMTPEEPQVSEVKMLNKTDVFISVANDQAQGYEIVMDQETCTVLKMELVGDL